MGDTAVAESCPTRAVGYDYCVLRPARCLFSPLVPETGLEWLPNRGQWRNVMCSEADPCYRMSDSGATKPASRFNSLTTGSTLQN